MTTPRVSIGLPVYNGQTHLREAVDSLLAQTHANIELILADNASTDTTGAICEQYAMHDTRVRYHRHKHNLGAIANFNYAIKQARGDFFMWAAHDDRWDPEFIELNLAELAADRDAIASISQARTIEAEAYITSDTFPLTGEPADNVLAYLRHPGANSRMYALFRRDVLLQSIDDEVFWGFDWLWMVRTLQHGTYRQVPRVLFHRRRDGESADKADAVCRYNSGFWGRVFPKASFTRRLWRQPHVRKNAAMIAFLIKCNVKDSLAMAYRLIEVLLPPVRPLLGRLRRRARGRW